MKKIKRTASAILTLCLVLQPVTPALAETEVLPAFFEAAENGATAAAGAEAAEAVETAAEKASSGTSGESVTETGTESLVLGSGETKTVKYLDEHGEEREAECLPVESSTQFSFENGKWYVVEGEVTISNRIISKGTANLILADGCEFTVSRGIETPEGKSLSIYAQSTSSFEAGSLIIDNPYSYSAGIGGGENGSGGNITINGGKVTAKGGDCGAGIGGGKNGSGGNITINGGMVTAEGGDYGAGIGGGINGDGGIINILRGAVDATGGEGAAGIGGGTDGSGGVIIILDGEVTAAGGEGAAGIGGGSTSASHGTLITDEKKTEILAGSSPETRQKVTLAKYRADRNRYALIRERVLQEYTVTWILSDETDIDETTVTEGDMPSHADAEKEDCIFTGWTPALSPVTADITYTAKFVEKDPEKLLFSFDTDGGSFVDPQLVMPGEKAERPAEPEKTGYVFRNWYEDMFCKSEFDFDTPVTEDTVVYAGWDVESYTVTWLDYEGKEIVTTQAEYGTIPEFPAEKEKALEREGYVFTGWAPELGIAVSDEFYMAQYEEKTIDVRVVSFDTGGGSFVRPQLPTYGGTVTRPADPQKTGYVFSDWYADKKLETPFDFSKKITEDTVIYAGWTKIPARKYMITWKDWNGKALATTEVEEGGLPDYPGTSNPARSGYVFTGWTPKIGLAYADTEYTAAYALKTIINGGGGGGGVPAAKKPVVTFSPNWYADNFGVWRIKNSAGKIVTNAWLCDDAVAANGQNVWYLITQDGAMLAAGLVQDATGNFYSLETNHDGYFGMLRYTDGYYNCNGQQVYLQFSQKHDGTFGAITNAEGLEKLKAIYGVTQYGIGNENAVYTKTF